MSFASSQSRDFVNGYSQLVMTPFRDNNKQSFQRVPFLTDRNIVLSILAAMDPKLLEFIVDGTLNQTKHSRIASEGDIKDSIVEVETKALKSTSQKMTSTSTQLGHGQPVIYHMALVDHNGKSLLPR